MISERKALSREDMAPMYILTRDIDDRKTTAAMRLRLIRTYDIVQSRYSDKQLWTKIKSLEGIDPKVLIGLKSPKTCTILTLDREALELLGGITAEELKAMQPKVPTKIPKEICIIGCHAIKDDIAVFERVLSWLLKVTKEKATNSVELLDDDLDSDAGFFSDERLKALCQIPLTQVTKGGGNDSEAVKKGFG
nr:uncharacterized protein LOC109162730 [Ipomoea batatas]